MTINIEPYQLEYSTFITNYKSNKESPVDAETIGFLIVRMAQYFSEYNLKAANAASNFYDVAAENSNKVDPENGKTISVAKADKLSAATPESKEFDKMKAHLVNLEQIINALKALQKGVLNEYSHLGNT